MSFWSHNLKQTAQLKTFSGLSTSGQESYNSPVDINCRVEFGVDDNRSVEGQSGNNTSVIYTDTKITNSDKIVLPDGDEVELNNVTKSSRLKNPNDILYKGEF